MSIIADDKTLEQIFLGNNEVSGIFLGSTQVYTKFPAASGGIETVIEQDGKFYKVHTFLESGNLTVTPGTDKVQVFAGVRRLGTVSGWSVSHGGNEDRWFARMGPAFACVDGEVNTLPFSAVYTGIADDTDTISFRINGDLRGTATGDTGENFGKQVTHIGSSEGTAEFFNSEISDLTTRFGPNLTTAQI